MMKRLLIGLALSLQWALGATYYVAPAGGSDAGPGSLASPYATIAKGVSMLTAGDTLILKNGTYSQRLAMTSKVGTSIAPITVQAETDYGVTLQGPVSGNGHMNLTTCAYVIVEGIKITDGSGTLGWLDGSTNCTIRRMVFRRPNSASNSHCLAIDGTYSGVFSRSNLVEDCIFLQFHRHAIIVRNLANSTIIRRNYANPMGYVGTGTQTTAREGFSAYGGQLGLYENNVVVGAGVISFSVHGSYQGGPSTRFIGNVAITEAGTTGYGWIVNSRLSTGAAYLTNVTVANCVSIGAKERAGFLMWHGSNNTFSNCVAADMGTVPGFLVSQEDFFWGNGGSDIKDDALRTMNHSVTLTNVVAVGGSSVGFSFGYETGDGGYQGIQTSTVRNSTAYGNASTISIYSSPHVVVNNTGFLTTNPGYDTTTYGNGAYLMPAPSVPTRGATVLYKCVNGSITTDALWPWPTDAQVIIETGGTGVTYEADGGIWKTLNGVYDFSPPNPAFVSVKATGDSAYEYPITAQTFEFTRTITTGEITAHFTISGTAIAGTHYVAFSDEVTFPAGTATVTATVTPILTGLDEAKTVIVTLDADPENPDTYAVSGGAATITIQPRARAGAGFRPPPGQRSFRSFP